MKLDNFILEKYDKTNKEHNMVVQELSNDMDSKKYLGNLDYANAVIEKRKQENPNNYIYIAYSTFPVGYISLTYKDNQYYISYGIVPKYRGEYLGALLLQEFSEKIFEEYNHIDELTLSIHKNNIKSYKVANLAGYKEVEFTKFKQRR
jgi:RimJ/RimL family protein N-acetyltransferase